MFGLIHWGSAFYIWAPGFVLRGREDVKSRYVITAERENASSVMLAEKLRVLEYFCGRG